MGTRRRSLLMLAVVVAAAITTGLAVGGNGETNKKTFEYAVGLWGDLPYSDVQISTGVPNLLAVMSWARDALTLIQVSHIRTQSCRVIRGAREVARVARDPKRAESRIQLAAFGCEPVANPFQYCHRSGDAASVGRAGMDAELLGPEVKALAVDDCCRPVAEFKVEHGLGDVECGLGGRAPLAGLHSLRQRCETRVQMFRHHSRQPFLLQRRPCAVQAPGDGRCGLSVVNTQELDDTDCT